MISSLIRSLSSIGLLFIAAFSALAQKPELVVQTGHLGSVHSVAFSPDGRTLASGSKDKTIKLWDVATGTELRTLEVRSDDVNSVAFSPDGKILASGISSGRLDNTVRLWDVSTGIELHTLKGNSYVVSSVAFSPDGKILASGDGATVSLADVSTGTKLRTLEGNSHTINSVAFSPDGKTLACGCGKTVKLWDVSTGTQLRTLEGNSHTINSVAFSPDGRTLASGSDDHTVKLWEVSTGTELRTLQDSNLVNSVAFSPDGKTLASGSGNVFGRPDNTVRLWEVATGTELRTLKGHSSSVLSVAFSSNGKVLASGGDDGFVKLWDVSTGTELRTLRTHSNGVSSIAFSPEGKTIVSGNGGTVKLWDVSTGAELRTLKGHSNWVSSVAFSADGKTLASGSFDNTVKLWEVSTGTELATFPSFNSVYSVAFSPDGKTLASGSQNWDETVTLRDFSTGTELRTLKGHSDMVKSVAFSPDGKTLASGSVMNPMGNPFDKSAVDLSRTLYERERWKDVLIQLWDVSTGTELPTFKRFSNSVYSVAFSPDGKTLASGEGGTVNLADVSTGTKLRTLKGHSGWVYSVAFSPDGRTVASGSEDNSIKLWDVSTGTELRTLKRHSNWVKSVAFSPDGKTLASGSGDGNVKLWEVTSGNELASLIAFDEHDWIVITPDGLFDGSPAAWNKIIWRFNNNTFNYAPVEAFYSDYYYPGLLTDIFAGKRPKAPSDISQKDRRQPQLRLALADAQPNATVKTRNLGVKVDVSQAPAGAQDVRLFRNGSLVKVWRGDVLKGQGSATLEATIAIIAGENRITAYAFNHDNIKSSDASLTIIGADILKRKGVAYVLAVGVNAYANTQYNLKYAVADAQDFAAELKLQQAKLNNYERVEVISLNDRDATKANILKSLTDLSAKIQPEDALIIYFAGHGTAQQNRFYLIPTDLGYAGSRTQLDSVGLRNILAHSISDEEVSRAVEKINAGQMLLVIDACNSGQALEAEEKRRGPMNSKGLAQLAYEKGMYILTAAQSYQAAQEAARLGHGFLTYALVEEGLKTKVADRDPQDGLVLLREWLNYATERVPQMQQGELDEQKKQGRQLDRIKFAETDSGNERSIQRPRVFYRRETETRPLVVTRAAATGVSSGKPIRNSKGIEMVWIPPGSFDMGTNKRMNEKPVHRVTIGQGFFMGRYEVTQAQWQAVMGSNPSSFKGDNNLPVEQVSWNDAQEFINKLNEMNDGYKYRLPTEAEWEYACRAGTSGDYYAQDPDDIAWYSDNSGKKTHQVGTKQANAFGLYDMSGNVWEWCRDWYVGNYEGAPTDGSARLTGGEMKYRVLRGGSWDYSASGLRSAHRNYNIPDYRYNNVFGFRVVAVVRTQ